MHSGRVLSFDVDWTPSDHSRLYDIFKYLAAVCKDLHTTKNDIHFEAKAKAGARAKTKAKASAKAKAKAKARAKAKAKAKAKA